LVSLGLIIGSFMESPEGYGMVASFAVYPMFLLSGAFYPLDKLPSWLKVLTFIDPGTYAVDGLRSIIIGVSTFSFAMDILVLLAFDAVFIAIGTWAFNRMKL
jgi:ABC-2 type transport system permease protein